VYSKKWQDHIAKLERHEPFSNHEYKTRTREGKILQMSISGVPVFAADETFLGYRGTGSDITEQKQAEDAQRESEEKYRSIFDNAQVGIIRSRISDGKPLEANDRLAEILGYENHEDAIANHRADNHWNDPRDREAWVAEGMKFGFVRNFDGQLKRKNGSIVHISSSATFNTEQNYVDVVMVDQTERTKAAQAVKESEERHRSLVELAPDAILITTDVGVVFANSAAASMFGARNQNDLLGKSLHDIMDPDSAPEVVKRRDRILCLTSAPLGHIEVIA
jgi:PAS domain S-box-containing protein